MQRLIATKGSRTASRRLSVLDAQLQMTTSQKATTRRQARLIMQPHFVAATTTTATVQADVLKNTQRMPSVGFVGGGQMATALASGILSSGFSTVEKIIAGDVYESSRKAFTDKTGAAAVASNEKVVSNSDIVILAVKPQVMKGVLREISPYLTRDKILVSIVAGFTIPAILDGLTTADAAASSTLRRQDVRVVRVMPNTPALVGKAASAYARGGAATAEDAKLVEQLLKGVGIGVEVPDHLLDAVTALSGSGPAYVYQFIEALSDGGVRVGLPRDIATKLAAQTVFGAASMVIETGEHPGSLKDKVTSPGGTTIAGVHALEKGAVRAAVMDAVQAACDRSVELGRL